DDASSTYTVTIQPRKGWNVFDLKELWLFRDLLWTLTARDVKVRYKQAVLGGLWAILQPLVSMVVFTLIFGKLAGMDQQIDADVPYEVFLYAGLLGWQFFETSVVASSASLVSNANMLRKIYFPRLLMPVAA